MIQILEDICLLPQITIQQSMKKLQKSTIKMLKIELPQKLTEPIV